MADTNTDGAHEAPSYLEPKEAYELQRLASVEGPLAVALKKLIAVGTPFSFSALSKAMEEVTEPGTPELLSEIRKFLVGKAESTHPDAVATLAAVFENDKGKVVAALVTAFLRTPEGVSAIPTYQAARTQVKQQGGYRRRRNG
jgi:hypothetical protein